MNQKVKGIKALDAKSGKGLVEKAKPVQQSKGLGTLEGKVSQSDVNQQSGEWIRHMDAMTKQLELLRRKIQLGNLLILLIYKFRLIFQLRKLCLKAKWKDCSEVSFHQESQKPVQSVKHIEYMVEQECEKPIQLVKHIALRIQQECKKSVQSIKKLEYMI